MNSYQKQKAKYEAKIKQLESDIRSLVNNDEKAPFVKLRYRFYHDIEEFILNGGATAEIPAGIKNTHNE